MTLLLLFHERNKCLYTALDSSENPRRTTQVRLRFSSSSALSKAISYVRMISHRLRRLYYLFIESMKSLFVFVTFNLSSKNSMLSTVLRGFNTFLSIHILFRSSLLTSSSSLRVPDAL